MDSKCSARCCRVGRQRLSMLLVAACLSFVASCGDSDGSADTLPDVTTPATTGAGSEATSSASTTPERAPESTTVVDKPWETGASGEVPAGTANFPGLGGVTMELPDDTFVFQAENCLFFEPAAGGDITLAQVSGSVMADDSSGTPTGGLSIADLLALYPADNQPTGTDETISVLGVEVRRYEFVDVPSPEGEVLSCGVKGQGSPVSFLPGPFGVMYLGEREGGVLMVVADGYQPDDAAVSELFLDAILPTIGPRD